MKCGSVLSGSLLLLAGVAPALAQRVVLRGATVIDGTDRPPRPKTTVVLKDGWIEAVGPDSEIRVPAGARVVDLTGQYVLPGFIEMHGHVAVGAWEMESKAGKPVMRYAYDEAASREVIQSELAFGITTVRNPGGPTEDAVRLRNEVRLGDLIGPQIVTAGAPLARPGPNTAMDPVVTEADVRAAVRRQAEAGVDLIKLYSTVDSAQVRVAVDEAHRLGLRTVGHLWFTSWTDAARSGIDAITHITPNSPALLPESRRAEYAVSVGRGTFTYEWFRYADFDGPEIRGMIDQLVAHRIAIDPTLGAFEATAWADDPTHFPAESNRYVPPSYAAKIAPRTPSKTKESSTPQRGGWSKEDFASAHRQFDRMLELTRRLHEAGVPLTVGTDAANPWFYQHELELLVRAGIPAADVLRMATRNGARSLGLIAEIGTVEPVKRANLVVLDADPIADITNTRRISWVIHGGRMARPETYLPERLRKRPGQ